MHHWADGATYDPGADTWSSLPASPLLRRSGHSAVWTGTDVLIWGGGAEDRHGGDPESPNQPDPPDFFMASDGAAYRP
jgi:hypothetical protein